MLRSPMDIPCRTCGAPAGAPCVYTFHEPRLHMHMPGYHDERKYIDFFAAQDAVKALLDG